MSSEPDRRSGIAVSALDFIVGHRTVDIFAVVFLVVAWCVGILPILEMSQATATTIASGTATLAGLVIAATAFVCTMVYTSENAALKSARRKFGKTSSRNWRFILLTEFASALGAVASLFVVETNLSVSITISVASIALLSAEFLRTVIWLDATLLAEHQGQNRAKKLQVLRPPA